MTHYTVRPDVAAFLQALRESEVPSFEGLTIEEARGGLSAICDTVDDGETPLAVKRDFQAEVPGQGVPVRLYDRRVGRQAGPLIVFYHGGGFVGGNLDSHDAFCVYLADQMDMPVLSVDYRLAPEHPFPAALDDAEAVTRWAADSPALLGFEVTGLITCGDSAGGNLALVVGQKLALRPATAPLLAQWALYPLVSGDWDWPSMRELGEGYMATEAVLRWFMQQYGAPADDPRYACLSGEIPADVPLLVHTAELDPLRDQGRAYAAKAQAAGTPTWQLESSGQIHGFATMRKTLPSAQGDVDAFIEAAKATLEVSGV